MSGPFGKLQNVGQAAALKTIGMAVKMEGSPTILFKVALRAYFFFACSSFYVCDIVLLEIPETIYNAETMTYFSIKIIIGEWKWVMVYMVPHHSWQVHAETLNCLTKLVTGGNSQSLLVSLPARSKLFPWNHFG